MKTQTKATFFGFGAILLWSLIVGLVKEVSDYFGPTGGAALIYTVAFFFLTFTTGWTAIKQFPKKYLIYGSILMVSYEICLALSIGHSHSGRQAIEVGMVNYIWPTFTIIATIIFNKVKASWLIMPGVIISMLGIVWVLSGKEGLNVSELIINIQTNPLSYGLAFLGAIIWSAYIVVTTRIAKGVNGITFFFMLVAIVLWIKFFTTTNQPEMRFNFVSIWYLILAGFAMGCGYSAWNFGILHGNVTLLAGASYFTPVLSSALSSILLKTPLEITFWQGGLAVCLGSILCFWATKDQSKHKSKR